MKFEVGDRIIISDESDAAFGWKGTIQYIVQGIITVHWDDGDKTKYNHLNFCRKLTKLEKIL